MGLGPVTSLCELYIIGESIGLRAPLIAALVRRSGRYSYQVVQLDNQACVIDFYDRGQFSGRSSFTMEDARTAGLAGKDTYRKYPRNLLWARAMSNGARWFCADVFDGGVYTPEELGIDTPYSVTLED
jgi:hypothetical protein